MNIEGFAGIGHLNLLTWSLRIILRKHPQLHACLAFKALNLLLYPFGLQIYIVFSACPGLPS